MILSGREIIKKYCIFILLAFYGFYFFYSLIFLNRNLESVEGKFSVDGSNKKKAYHSLKQKGQKSEKRRSNIPNVDLPRDNLESIHKTLSMSVQPGGFKSPS